MSTNAHRRIRGLIPALLGVAALVISGPPVVTPATSLGRTTPAQAWPRAEHADLPGDLADGSTFQPALFADATTVVGTAVSADGNALRLLVRGPGGGLRRLRQMPTADQPQFDQVTALGDELIWTEMTDRQPLQIWTAPLHGNGAASRLTADTGDATFYGDQYGFVAGSRRLYWTAVAGDTQRTEIRSVALTGGPVRVRDEPGTWALSAWPWITDYAANPTGTLHLHNLSKGRTVTVTAAAQETLACTPVWCRAMVMNGAALDHIDLVHPDGSGRRRIAGGDAQAGATDVAVLDRFEILSQPGPDSDLTGTAALLVYDVSTGGTVELSPYAGSVSTRNGMLWWSTGDQETTVWHSIDLRTA